jgi:hypothetical protein
MSVVAGTLGASPEPRSRTAVAGISVPGSQLASEATAIALASGSPEIFAHSLRTFYFAELVARKSGIDHDAEAVYVACILHDVGLAPSHMSETRRFEVDSATIARNLLHKHGIVGARADLVWDAVALHDQAGIARWKQAEVMLVNAGVNTDFGANLEILERRDVTAILRAAPRTGFVPAFLDVVAEYVRRKPFATGNSWITDVGYRMVPGFHVANFVDEVRDDPFKEYG